MGKKKPAAAPAAAPGPNEALKAFAKARGLRQPIGTLACLHKPAPAGAVAPSGAVADAGLPQPQNDDVDPKTDFTARELRFLDIYFSPSPKKPSIERMLQQAGYRGGAHHKTAKRILDKFCARTDPREIFRRVGLSEESIATRLLDIADDKTVAAGTRVQALSIASKCLGLQREVVESSGGARIVICGDDPEEEQAQQTGQQGEDRPAKPISIVR